MHEQNNREKLMTETAMITYESITIQDFEGKDLVVKKEDTDLWMTMEECGILLEYKHPDKAISNLFSLHKKEFTNDITRTLESRVSGNLKKVTREFNLEGFYLLCMHSAQPKAVLARKWAIALMGEMTRKGYVGSPQIITTVDQLIELVDRAQLRPEIVNQEWLYRHANSILAMSKEYPVYEKSILLRLDDVFKIYKSNYAEPVIPGRTPLTEDWFKVLYVGQQWSRDAMQLTFRHDIETKTAFERIRRQYKIRPNKDALIPHAIAMRMFCDFHTPVIRKSIDDIVLEWKKYSRDAIEESLKGIEVGIELVFFKNEDRNVIAFQKKPYTKYLNSKPWNNKKHVLIFPFGPFDRCWLCGCYIDLGISELHHNNYDRVGFEVWKEDLMPLCPKCHQEIYERERTETTNQNNGNYGLCPDCNLPLVKRTNKGGHPFIGCSGWTPSGGCKYTRNL